MTSRIVFAAGTSPSRTLVCLAVIGALSAPGTPLAQEAREPPVPTQAELEQLLIEEQRDAGRSERPDTDQGYVGLSSRTATKTDLPLAETPRSVSIVTREQIEDRAPVSIADALQYTPSIQANYFGEDNKQDWFVIRGFPQANNGLYRDGTRIYSSGFYSWQIDPFSLERVEILRGAASVLYGQTPPGGIINLVSRRPFSGPLAGSVAVEAGSFDRAQLSADVGGSIAGSDHLSGRLLALGRDNGTQVDGVEAQRLLLAPSLTARLNKATGLTVFATFQDDDSDPYLQFLPGEGTVRPGAPGGYIGDDVAVGNPDFETFQRTQSTVGYQLDVKASDTLDFQQNARFGHISIDLEQMYFSSFAADLSEVGAALDPNGERRAIVRGVSTEDGSANTFSIDNRALFDVELGRTSHAFMLGLDYQSLSSEGKDFPSDPLAGDGNALLPGTGTPNPAFDIYAPVYTDDVVLLDPGTLQPYTDADRETRSRDAWQAGVYVQDRMKFGDKLVLTLSGRYDVAEADLENETTGTKDSIDDDEWTTGAGVGYLFSNGFTPYLSFAQYFQPILQVDENDRGAKPERGELLELGVKYQPLRFDGSFNAALFGIRQGNLAQTDFSTGTLSQVGEVESIGLELEAVANLTPSLNLVANATLLDTEITEDALNEEMVGKRPAAAAEELASVWAHYTFGEGTLNGLAFGAGVRYVGDAYGDNTENVRIPSYSLVDATVSYRWKDLKAQLAVSNLADESYVTTCSGGDYFCWYGNRRSVIGSLRYDF